VAAAERSSAATVAGSSAEVVIRSRLEMSECKT
jgi:hypothetical protein